MPFDDRDELDEARAALVAQEPVHLAASLRRWPSGRVVSVFQSTPCRAGPPARASPGRRCPCRPCRPVGVVHVARAVDRDPDQEPCSREERRPTRRRSACHSSGSCAATCWPGREPLRELDRAAEEVEPHQRRLAALPGDRHLRRRGAPRSAGGCRSRAARPPSETGCPDTASPSTGRSSTRSRGCRWRRSASRAGGMPEDLRERATPSAQCAHRPGGRPRPICMTFADVRAVDAEMGKPRERGLPVADL